MSDSELVEQAVQAATQAPPVSSRAVPYAPVPMSWNISQAKTNEGQPVVVIQIQTPEGDKVFFVQPDIGKQLGEALVRFSSAADSGLIIPQ